MGLFDRTVRIAQVKGSRYVRDAKAGAESILDGLASMDVPGGISDRVSSAADSLRTSSDTNAPSSYIDPEYKPNPEAVAQELEAMKATTPIRDTVPVSEPTTDIADESVDFAIPSSELDALSRDLDQLMSDMTVPVAEVKPPVKKPAARKPAAKKAPAARKPAAKKTPPAKKPAAKKPTTARKPAVKKPTTARKPVVKKPAAVIEVKSNPEV